MAKQQSQQPDKISEEKVIKDVNKRYEKEVVQDVTVQKNAKKKDVIKQIKAMYREDAEVLGQIADLELAQEQEKQRMDESYTIDRSAIIKKHMAKLRSVRDIYKDTIKIAGGEDKELNTDAEVLDYSLYFEPYLRGLDLENIHDSVEKGEGADEMLVILDKLSENKGITEEDYKVIAGQLLALADQPEFDPDKASRSVIDMGKTTFMIVAAGLVPKQRFELGRILINQSEKGARVVHKLTQIGYFSIAQSKEIFSSASPGIWEQYRRYFDENIYVENQKRVREYLDQAIKYIDYEPHRNLAKKYLSAFYIAVWEGGRYGLGLALLMNEAAEIKHGMKTGDYSGCFTNPVVLASTAGILVLTDVMSDGRLSSSLLQDKDKRRLEERQERLNTFREAYLQTPDLAKWVYENSDKVFEGFKKVNPLGDENLKNQPITFADMGITDGPKQLDDTRDEEVMAQRIGTIASELYFTLGAKEPSSFTETLGTIWEEEGLPEEEPQQA